MSYTTTVTLDTPRLQRISRNYGVLIGQCDITDYDKSGAEITDITRFFTDDTVSIRVLNDGLSDEGYLIRWDTSDKCFHAFESKPIPQLIVEESVSVTSPSGTLANVPFYIIAIHVTSGNATGAFSIIPTGETVATKQCAVTLTTGALAFYSTDAVVTALVTYIPLQTTGPFVESNRVVDEVVTASASKVDLAAQACALQYVWDDTDNVINEFEPVSEEPTSTHFAVVDIDDGSNDTNIDSHSDDAGNDLKVTYIKYSALDPDLCIGDGDTTLTSEAVSLTYPYVAIPGLGTSVCGEETGNANQVAIWEGPSGTAANEVATWFPGRNYILTANSSAFVTLSIPYFLLDTSRDSQPYSVEVLSGTNVGVVNFVAYGLI